MTLVGVLKIVKLSGKLFRRTSWKNTSYVIHPIRYENKIYYYTLELLDSDIMADDWEVVK